MFNYIARYFHTFFLQCIHYRFFLYLIQTLYLMLIQYKYVSYEQLCCIFYYEYNLLEQYVIDINVYFIMSTTDLYYIISHYFWFLKISNALFITSTICLLCFFSILLFFRSTSSHLIQLCIFKFLRFIIPATI